MNKENSTLWQRSTVRMESGEEKKRKKGTLIRHGEPGASGREELAPL